MKLPGISQAPPFARYGTVDQRIGILERTIDEIRRALDVLRKKQIGKENLKDGFLTTELFSDSTYGTTSEIEDLRLGDPEDAGVSGTVARADHKHAIDPVLILERTDPTQLAANTNDWALDADRSLFYVDAAAAYNVTGIAGGVDGWCIYLVNDGSFDITLTHQDALSVAANRIITGGAGAPVVLNPSSCVCLIYDSTSARWRVAGGWGI